MPDINMIANFVFIVLPFQLIVIGALTQINSPAILITNLELGIRNFLFVILN